MTKRIANRLEILRKTRGYDSLREFWGELDTEVSYTSARNYHAGDNQPSVRYLSAVSRRFDVALDWIVKGESVSSQGVTDSEIRSITDRVESILRDELP